MQMMKGYMAHCLFLPPCWTWMSRAGQYVASSPSSILLLDDGMQIFFAGFQISPPHCRVHTLLCVFTILKVSSLWDHKLSKTHSQLVGIWKSEGGGHFTMGSLFVKRWNISSSCSSCMGSFDQNFQMLPSRSYPIDGILHV